jgi:hypothetical protein
MLGEAFIGGEGRGGRAARRWTAARRRPPLRLGGDLGARPLQEGEEGEGAGRRRVSARRTKGEEEEARGGEGRRASGGRRGQGGGAGGWSLKMALTGGPHLSAA